MTDKTAVCVDCGQTDLREHMIKSPRGFIHTFTRRCQNTWQSQVEAADNERDAAIARAEAAERRVQKLEAQLAAMTTGWIKSTEVAPPHNTLIEVRAEMELYQYQATTAPGDYEIDMTKIYEWRLAPPQDTPASGRRQYNQDKS